MHHSYFQGIFAQNTPETGSAPGAIHTEETQANQPSSSGSYKPKAPNKGLLFKAIGVIVILAVMIIGYKVIIGSKSTATTVTTSVSKVYTLSSCNAITSPGTYLFTKDINAKIANGTCIDIQSSNVKLIGNNYNLIGIGPFIDLPPYSYAIRIEKVGNVTISQINVTKFSYGIYLNGTFNSRIQNVTVKNSTLSNLLLLNAYNNTVSNSKFLRATSPKGSIVIYSGSSNKFYNILDSYNTYYGLVINSTGNAFYNNTVSNNPIDLSCGSKGNYANTNNFSSSTCYINYYCNFATCLQRNNFANLTPITLSTNVTTCGNIRAPGKYKLSKNVSLIGYVNTSAPASNSIACLTISAGNVKLDCNNKKISHSGYGILSGSTYNVTIANCDIENNTNGVLLTGVLNSNIANMRLYNNYYSIYLKNTTGVNVTNTIQSNNKYGLYVNASSSVTVNKTNSTYGSYGVFIDNSTSLSFSQASLNNAKKMDFYCAINAYNATSDKFTNSTCGVTDCLWAQCKTKVLPPISVLPINSCIPIQSPGNYSLNKNVTSPTTCFNITASFVNINCNGHSISSAGSGSAFQVNGQRNVTIVNCKVFGFANGVNATNSSVLTLQTLTLNSSTQNGVRIKNGAQDTISSVTISPFAKYGFKLNNVTRSSITKSLVSGGSTPNATAFLITNSTNNIFTFNNATSSSYGFYTSSSKNNTLFNNTAFSNLKYDFYCSKDSSGIDNNTGVDYGYKKSGCNWLAMVPLQGLTPQCTPISAAATIALTQDFVYPYGTTCYNLYNTRNTTANNTVINCNGHTVYATRGGTFVNDINSSSVKVQNCYFKNFTTPIIISFGFGSTIYNNTISKASTGIQLSNSQQLSIIRNNRIIDSVYGIIVTNSKLATISNNSATALTQGMTFNGVQSSTITNNTASNDNVGISLINSAMNRFQNNKLLNETKNGITCDGISGGLSQNSDIGGNSCTNNAQCTWMTTSTACKPS